MGITGVTMRYNGINGVLKTHFGEKVYKISIDIPVNCPNRDGLFNQNGCIYCNPDSNLATTFSGRDIPISRQIDEGIQYIKGRHHAKKFIAYLQNYSNTYAPTEKLAKWYGEAIHHPDIVGLAVSTRPDCISSSALDLLTELNKKTFLWVELGLQSANDEMLIFLNRGHTVEQFIETVKRLHKRKIRVCAHVIIGLPNESYEDLDNIINLINGEKIGGIKIHNLHVLKNTFLEELFNDGKIKLIDLEEYTKRVIYVLERLDPKVVIHRFNSHSPKDLTVEPKWSINKLSTFNAVEAGLKKQDTFQGKFYRQPSLG